MNHFYENIFCGFKNAIGRNGIECLLIIAVVAACFNCAMAGDDDFKMVYKNYEDTADHYFYLSSNSYRKGDYKDSQKYDRWALKLYTLNPEYHEERIVCCYLGIAGAAKEMGNYDEALATYKELQETYKQLYGKDYKIYDKVADIYFLKGDYHEAIANYNEVLKICKKRKYEYNSDEMHTNGYLASCFDSLGEPEKALPYALQAYKMSLKILGSSHSTTRIYRANLRRKGINLDAIEAEARAEIKAMYEKKDDK